MIDSFEVVILRITCGIAAVLGVVFATGYLII